MVALGLGSLAARADVGLLAVKTRDAVLTVLLAADVVGVADRLRRLGGGRATWSRWVPGVTPVPLVGASAASAAHHFTEVWVTGRPALVAQTTRYPDGSAPTAEPADGPYIGTLLVRPSDPPVERVRQAWRELRPDLQISDALLVTSHVTCWPPRRSAPSSPTRASTPTPTAASRTASRCASRSPGARRRPAPEGCCAATASTRSTAWCCSATGTWTRCCADRSFERNELGRSVVVALRS